MQNYRISYEHGKADKDGKRKVNDTRWTRGPDGLEVGAKLEVNVGRLHCIAAIVEVGDVVAEKTAAVAVETAAVAVAVETTPVVTVE